MINHGLSQAAENLASCVRGDTPTGQYFNVTGHWGAVPQPRRRV